MPRSSSESFSFLEALETLGAKGLDELDAVFQHAPFGVYVDHPTLGCTYANPFLLEQFGVTWEDFKGFGWARFIVPEDVERMQVAIQEYEHSREPIRVTYRVQGPHTDEVRWVHARVRAVVDAEGERVGSIGVTTDVTEERRFAEQVASSQKLEAVGRLSARLAHDLNNLLTVIMGSSSLLESTSSDKPEHADHLDAIDSACAQACQLTEQLLLLSRRRVGGPAACELDVELHRLERLVRGTLGEGVTVEMDLQAAGTFVPLDPSSIGQILLNLATNGRDAMEGRGHLRIVTRSSESTVTLLVEDEGVGMDADTTTRAWEPFFTTKEEGRGTGLGLTTVRDLVDVVGGSIVLDSEVGGGTRAHVTLPTVAGVPRTDGTAPRPVRAAEPATILIVEDNEAVRQSMAYSLALAGHTVESSGSLAEARSQVEDSGPFDLIVSDVLLPDGSGVDLYRELSRGRELPAVFVSGFAGRDADFLSDITGPVEFLPKPFRPDAIVDAVARVTPRGDS